MRIIIIAATIFITSMQAQAYVSTVFFSVSPGTIDFSVTNPNGLITGYSSGGINNQIPEMPYYAEDYPAGADYTDLSKKSHIIATGKTPVQVTSGKYKITLYGARTTTKFHTYIEFRWGENIHNKAISIQNNVLIYPDVAWTYELDVPETIPANRQLFLVKVSNSNDLIADITAAEKLNYIGNKKFASKLIKKIQVFELLKEINEIETEKAKGKMDDSLTPAQKAKKEYTELLNEITEKYNKPEDDEFVKQEAYTVLREDLEYIISHL